MPRFGRSFPMRNPRLRHQLAASPVSASVAVPYAVNGVVAQTRTLPYGMGGAVSASLAIPYAVTVAVAQTRRLPWSMTGAVAQTRALPWTVSGAVSRSVRLLWVAQNGVTFTLTDDFQARLGKLTLAYGIPLQSFTMGTGSLVVFTTSDIALVTALRQLATENTGILIEGLN